MSFVCFIRLAEYGVIGLFSPSRLQALTKNGRIHANIIVLVLLS